MNCISDISTLQRLIQAIESSPPRPHHHTMLAAIDEVRADCIFQHVLSKGGWHRAGGVISADGERLGHGLEVWVNTELTKYGGDFNEFLDTYSEAGLLVTRHTGKTHFFVAPYGPAPEDFLQLEVEELQEVLDRRLIDPERPPQDRTELVEPITSVKLDAHPVGNPRYRFARLVDIRELLTGQKSSGVAETPFARLLSDWSQSRSTDHGRFCEHWLIANLERYDPGSGSAFCVNPMSVHERALKPFQWDIDKCGVELGNQLRDFDRAAGYPGAWYFHLVASKLVPAELANNLKRDLDNGYCYLAEKDMYLLEKLLANPYHLGFCTD